MVEQQKNSVLIVDDEPDICWTLKTLLKKRGYNTVQALNGYEALDVMAPGRFNLIFLDAKLPDIEGLELATQLRNIDPPVRIVMISGYFYGTDDAVMKAVTAGIINGFVGKPFVHSEVLGMIRPSSVEEEKV